MQYDAVLFDMDGVLLTGRGTARSVYHEATRRAFRAFGVETYDEDQVRAFTDPDFGELGTICAEFGLDLEAFWRRREALATTLARERVGTPSRTLFDDVETISRLPTSLSLGVVSNNRQATVDYVLDYFDLASTFAVVLGRDPTVAGYRRRKPDPYYLYRALDAVDADAAVYVGDRSSDVAAATAAGVDSVLLDRPEHEPPHSCEPTNTMGSLRELPDCLA
jgi:phosphoglycolate phosphatase-like HAD superfamily hydrolase